MVWLDQVDSTNLEAARWAQRGELGPAWIAARRQTAGRGRRGRAWQDPEGNLAATFLTTIAVSPARVAQWSFVAALAVADALTSYGLEAVIALKWPNDPMIAGRKVSGILLESGSLADGRLWVAVGIGINLQHAPDLPGRAVTCLAEYLAEPPPSPQDVLERLSVKFAAWLDCWHEQGFGAIAEAWTARAFGLGQPCRAQLAHETIDGVALGLDAEGALRLRLSDQTERRISAGDVYF